MTGFEIYLQSKGYAMIKGKIGSFSTYDNISRTWIKNGKRIIIGLKDGIEILHPLQLPYCTWNGMQLKQPIPSESQYDIVLSEIESGATIYPAHLTGFKNDLIISKP